MNEFVRNQGIFLPMIWLVLSFGIAIFLYRTSKSFIEADQLFGLPVKQVRLGGSVVIFVIVFVMLRWATVTDRLQVHSDELTRLSTLATEADAARSDVAACIETQSLSTPRCEADVETLLRRWREVKAQIDDVTLPVASATSETPTP